jgi:protein-tyrosine phosphatase
MSEGHLRLDGAVNVRDIGGYRSAFGPAVTSGQLFRADSLSQLTPPDLDRLAALGLRAVIDFRTSGEILLNGADRLPPGIQAVSLPVSGGDLGAIYEVIASGDPERQQQALGAGRAADFMVAMNRGFVSDARQREQFGAALRMIAGGRVPLLYHCTGGKDRTGWMTAIILTTLGVPREAVTRDYMLSNDYHQAGYAKLRSDLVKAGMVRDPQLLRPVLEQSPAYLDAAFDEAERLFGTFEDFLERGLGAGEAAQRDLRDTLLS